MMLGLAALGCDPADNPPSRVRPVELPPAVQSVSEPDKDSLAAPLNPPKPKSPPPKSLPSLPVSQEIQLIVGEVEQLLKTLVDSFPQDSEAYEIFGRYYYLVGNHDGAHDMWATGAGINARDVHCLNGLGKVCQARNDLEAAEAHFRKAIQLKSNEPSIQLNLAKTLLKQGKLDEAISANLQSLSAQSNYVEAWESLGQIYLANQQFELARKAFEETLKRSPTSHVAHQGITQALVRLNQTEEARKWLLKQREFKSKEDIATSANQNSAQERAQISQLLVFASNVYLKHGQILPAIYSLSFAVGCAPDESAPKQQLVDLCRQLKSSDAINAMKLLVDKRPNEIAFRLGLSELYARQEMWSQSQAMVLEAIKIAPETPQCYVSLISLLLSMPNADIQQSLVASNKLIQLRGSAADYALRAQTLHYANYTAEAKEALARALQLDPTNKAYRNIFNQLQAESSSP